MKNAYENREASSHKDAMGKQGPPMALVMFLGASWSHLSLNKKGYRASPRLWSVPVFQSERSNHKRHSLETQELMIFFAEICSSY